MVENTIYQGPRTAGIGRRTLLRNSGYLAVAMSLGGLGTAACTTTREKTGGSSGSSGTLVVAQSRIIPVLDHAALTTVSEYNYLYPIYDPLNRLTEDGEMELILAKSWEIESETSWIVQLRDDVSFHDGSKMTADDVVFSMNRYADPSLKSIYTAVYSYVVNVEKVDTYAVRIRTKSFIAGLPREYGRNCVLPKAAYEKVGREEFFKSPIGSGPFKFSRYSPGQFFEYTANADYFRGAPPFEKLTVKQVAEPQTRVAELLSGSASFVAQIPPTESTNIERADKKLSVYQTVNVIQMNFAQVTTPELRDPRVRRALISAVDVKTINREIYAGRGGEPNGWLDKRSLGYQADVEAYPYDPELSRRLLAEAGFAGGLSLPLMAGRGYGLLTDEITLAISDYLNKAGFKIDLQFVELGQFREMDQGGKYRGVFITTSRNTSGDPDQIFRRFDPDREDNYVRDSKLADLVHAQAAEQDPQKRLDLIQQVNRYITSNYIAWSMLTVPGMDGYDPGTIETAGNAPYEHYYFEQFKPVR